MAKDRARAFSRGRLSEGSRREVWRMGVEVDDVGARGEYAGTRQWKCCT